MAVYDKDGTPIYIGDIVKVFHFTGRNRKRYYMYKQCVGVTRVLQSGTECIGFDHLSMDGSTYEECGPNLPHYEIVQSVKCDHEDRKKVKP